MPCGGTVRSAAELHPPMWGRRVPPSAASTTAVGRGARSSRCMRRGADRRLRTVALSGTAAPSRSSCTVSSSRAYAMKKASSRLSRTALPPETGAPAACGRGPARGLASRGAHAASGLRGGGSGNQTAATAGCTCQSALCSTCQACCGMGQPGRHGSGQVGATCLEQDAHVSCRASPAVQVTKAQRVKAVHHLVVAAQPDGSIQQQPLQPARPELAAHLQRRRECSRRARRHASARQRSSAAADDSRGRTDRPGHADRVVSRLPSRHMRPAWAYLQQVGVEVSPPPALQLALLPRNLRHAARCPSAAVAARPEIEICTTRIFQ